MITEAIRPCSQSPEVTDPTMKEEEGENDGFLVDEVVIMHQMLYLYEIIRNKGRKTSTP